MELISPNRDYAPSWKRALQEFEAEGIGGFWNVPEKPVDIEEYLQRVADHSQGKNLPDYWMPATTFWLVDAGEFLGHANVRHVLVEWSRNVGGHIGFAVRPTARRKGCGTKILELALPEARKLGIERALVTCNDSNVASARIIEKNGGVLQDVHEVKGERVRRCWIGG